MNGRAEFVIVCALLAPPAAAQTGPAATAVAKHVAAADCAAADATVRERLQGRSGPDDRARLLVADCYLRAGQVQSAIAMLRGGLAAAPHSTILQRALGEALFREDPKSGEAGTLLRRVSQALPGDPEASHYYAQWAHVNRQDEICAAKEQAALRAPGLNDLAQLQMYTLLGMCQSRLEQVDGAKTSFRKARAINLKRASFDPMAQYQYVQLLTRLGEEKEAAALVDEILERAATFGPALLERAKALESSGRHAEAIDAALAALRGDGNDAAAERAAHGVLGRCYLATGNATAADGEQQWIQQHPNSRPR